MNHRTVLVKKDENGFGLRVSSDNPVYVETVKSDGAAWKAGVRSGDKIIKVNGHNVTNYNHGYVVKMIQDCGHQVVLTLEASLIKSQLCNNNSNFLNQNESINNSNSLPLNLATSTRIKPHSNFSNCSKDTLQRHITPPIPANDHTRYEFEKSKVETIRKMLGNEKELLNKLRKEDKNSNEKESEIKTTMKRIKQLEKSLSSINDHSKQAVARYIVPLDTSFANLRLSSSQKSTKTSSNSSINLQQNNSYSDSVINNISRKHLSAENLHFFTQLSSADANTADCQTKKSHSFGQYDHLTNNSSKNSETSSSTFYTSYSDIQPPNNSNNNFDDQEYNPNALINCKPSIDLLLEPSNVHLLMNFLHYLLTQKQDINPLLFYILTDLFKKVCENPKFSCLDNFSPLQYQIKKWAFEIYSTFLFNDSPLRLNCDISKDQNQFNELLNENFTNTSNLVNTIFDPFLDNCKDQINNQIDLFKKHLSSGLNIKKINPSEIIDCLTQDLIELPHQVTLTAASSSTLLGQIRILISYLLNNLKFSDTSVVAIAQLTCFTSIIYHCFPYFLISSDENANIFAKLIELPVPVYLSFHQTHSNHSNQLQHKRHKSLPASSNNQNSSAIPYHLSCSSQPTGNYNSNSSQNQQKNNTAINSIQSNKNQLYMKSGHIFSLLNTTKTNNCSGCNQSIWAMFGWHCQLCLLISHHWCLRSTAEDHHCPGPIDSVLDQCNDLNQNNINNLQHLTSTISSASSSSRKSKNAKSTGGRLFENILKNRSESLKQKKEESKICCRKKSDPSLCSSAFNDFSSIKSKFTQSPSSSSDSDLDENYFNQNEHSFSIFSDNLFNRDDQNLIDFNNDSKYVFTNSLYSNLPVKNNSSVKLSTEMKKASKRQDILKELISTERTHVKNLKILNDIFYVPIYKEQLLNQDQIDYVFSNHTKLYDIHSQIYYMLKMKKKEQQKFVQDQLQFPQQSNYVPLDHGIGQLLVNIFEGDIGNKLEEAASVFCARQTIGGDILRNKLKKDSRLSSFLTEAEANKCCRRLQLKDMLASCFQRITKYPLLMENLMKEIEDKESEEYKLIERACKRSKSILSTVNECVKQAENKQKLLEIHRKTEKLYINDQLVNFDFADKILVYEGYLTYRVVKKTFEVLVLLCKDVIIFLLKEGDKYFFKMINKNTLPIVQVKNVITRKNATDSRCFYLISSKDGLMYELVASSETEKNNWVKQIDEAAVQSGGEVRTAQIKLKDLTSRDDQSFIDENKIKSMNDQDDSQEILIKSDQNSNELKSPEEKEQDLNENNVSKAKIDGTISFVKDEDLSLNRKNLLLYQPTVDYAFSFTSRGQTIMERNQAIDNEIERLQNKNFIIDTEIERLQNEKFINDTEIERLRNEKVINARV